MTGSPLPEALETLAIPDEAIVVEGAERCKCSRELVVSALQQALRERRLALPLGPALDLNNPERLLNLNRFSLQLLIGGIAADQLAVPLAPWQTEGGAPQLLLAALVDAESAVVVVQGVLTGQELQRVAQSQGWSAEGGELLLEVDQIQGGVDRLLTLVQLLEPEALPQVVLVPASAAAVIQAGAAAVLDWLGGQLNAALLALGAELAPVSAGAFRSVPAALDAADQALALVTIPFGLAGEQLVSGEAAGRCVRRFQLTLIATGAEQPNGLMLRLASAVPGALLPDGLALEARQGSHRQVVTSSGDTELTLSFRGRDLLLVSLGYGDGEPVSLPPLQLPA